MTLKLCKGCYDVFPEFKGDYCEYCQSEIDSGDGGWLKLNQEVKNGTRKK